MQANDSESIRARSEAVRRYFTKTPSPPAYGTAIALGGFAALCTLPALAVIVMGIGKHEWNSCFSCVSVMSVLAAIGLIFPALLSYKRGKATYERNYYLAEPKPSDAEIDEWHRRDREFLKTYAMRKLDLSPEEIRRDNRSRPLVIVGPGPSAQVRLGADSVVRFSCHDVLIIYLTPYHLAAFRCVIDLHDGAIKTETTQEYHYENVVSVSTRQSHSPVTVYVEGQPREVIVNQHFALSVASGEQISVATGFKESLALSGNTTFAETGAEEAIRSIRSRLREKKGGAADTGSLQ